MQSLARPTRGVGRKTLTQRNSRLLGGLLLLYVAASLLHLTHNAEYLNAYPNLPPWLGRADIYGVWLTLAALGITGYIGYRHGYERTGLCLLGIYAIFGFDGLLHYARAPYDAHTNAMNFSIWFEVLAAACLLTAVLVRFRNRLRQHGSGA